MVAVVAGGENVGGGGGDGSGGDGGVSNGNEVKQASGDEGAPLAPSLVVSRASWLLAQHSSCCAAVPVPARLGHLAGFQVASWSHLDVVRSSAVSAEER